MHSPRSGTAYFSRWRSLELLSCVESRECYCSDKHLACHDAPRELNSSRHGVQLLPLALVHDLTGSLMVLGDFDDAAPRTSHLSAPAGHYALPAVTIQGHMALAAVLDTGTPLAVFSCHRLILAIFRRAYDAANAITF